MSVNSEINRIKTALANAYAKVVELGGTLPTSQTIANLADAIASIPTGGGMLSKVISLPTTGWTDDVITISITEIKADSELIVSPDPASIEEYASCGIYCTEQAEGSLKFKRRKAFDTALVVNILYK